MRATCAGRRPASASITPRAFAARMASPSVQLPFGMPVDCAIVTACVVARPRVVKRHPELTP
jgi:hypothetical protein